MLTLLIKLTDTHSCPHRPAWQEMKVQPRIRLALLVAFDLFVWTFGLINLLKLL